MVWTSPTGHTYTTKPGGSLFFPQLAIPSGELAVPARTSPLQDNRGLMMPTRRRTRAEDRTQRIAYERGLNEQRYARDYAAAPF